MDFAEEAVLDGQYKQEETSGDKRGLYCKQFEIEERGKKKGLLVLVSERDGEAFNIRYIKINQANRKGFIVADALKNRALLEEECPWADRQERNLSPALLNAMADSDRIQHRRHTA